MKGTTRKQSAIQQLSNCLTVGSVFSSATVILSGGTVGALAYLESSAVNADKPLEETSFVLEGLASQPALGRSLVWADQKSLVLCARREADAGSQHLCYLLAKRFP